MFGFINRHPFITLLATAAGIAATFFPPVLLLTAFAGAGTIGAYVAAAAITGVVATAVALGALKAFSTFVEWLSPIMFPAAVVSTVNEFEASNTSTKEFSLRDLGLSNEVLAAYYSNVAASSVIQPKNSTSTTWLNETTSFTPSDYSKAGKYDPTLFANPKGPVVQSFYDEINPTLDQDNELDGIVQQWHQ